MALQANRNCIAYGPIDVEALYYYQDDVVKVANEWLSVPVEGPRLGMLERAGKAAIRCRQAIIRMQVDIFNYAS